MSDIVERLRRSMVRIRDMGADDFVPNSLDRDAADEIERLRGVIEDVRHLLESDCSSQVLADFDEIVAEAEKQD